MCGEAVVNVHANRTDRQTDKENYIDFRLRLLGEPGNNSHIIDVEIEELYSLHYLATTALSTDYLQTIYLAFQRETE